MTLRDQTIIHTCCRVPLVLCFILMISDTKAAEARTSWNNQNPGIRGGEQQQLQEEDFVIMQMEIAWGVNEMHRYKKRHGDYPTRSESSFSAMTTSDGAGFADESLIEEDYLKQMKTNTRIRIK